MKQAEELLALLQAAAERLDAYGNVQLPDAQGAPTFKGEGPETAEEVDEDAT